MRETLLCQSRHKNDTLRCSRPGSPDCAMFWDFHFIFSPGWICWSLASPPIGWELTILDCYWLRGFCNIRMLAICSGDSDTDTRGWRNHTPNTIHILETRMSQYLSCLYFRQQLPRKRHIGNDIVTVVFQVSIESCEKSDSQKSQIFYLYPLSQEPGALPFIPNIRSQFQHVFIIVRAHNPCSDNTQYRSAQQILLSFQSDSLLFHKGAICKEGPQARNVFEFDNKIDNFSGK